MIALETNIQADEVEMHGNLLLYHYGKTYKNLVHNLENISDIPDLTKNMRNSEEVCKAMQIMLFADLVNLSKT